MSHYRFSLVVCVGALVLSLASLALIISVL